MPAKAARSGREEIDIIMPAIDALARGGLASHRPAPGRHHVPRRRRARSYDAALCMYHDQALIPLKALHFDEGVNITLGLPIVRTSPDHGTAFDIAGAGPGRPARDGRRDPHGGANARRTARRRA